MSLALFLINTDASSAAAPIKISFWNFFGGGDGIRMQQLISSFNKSQNEVQVEAVTLQWGVPFYTKVETSTASGDQPDLISFHLSRMPGWAPKGLLRPFSQGELASVGLAEKDFFPRLWNAATYHDKLYAIPLDTHPLVLYYNKTLAAKAGLLGPDGQLKPITSIEDFTADLQAIKKATGAYGVSFEDGPGAYNP